MAAPQELLDWNFKYSGDAKPVCSLSFVPPDVVAALRSEWGDHLDTGIWLWETGAYELDCDHNAVTGRCAYRRQMIRFRKFSDDVPRLVLAIQKGLPGAAGFLLGRGAYPDGGAGARGAPLRMAAKYARFDDALVLLNAGADVNARGRFGSTALHSGTCNMGHRPWIRVMKLLLSRGASLDARWHGQTPEQLFSTQFHGIGSLLGVDSDGDEPDDETPAVDFLCAVRLAGGWKAYVDKPRRRLRKFRRKVRKARLLLTARDPQEDLRFDPPVDAVRAFLFISSALPDKLFDLILAFWHTDRDY